jgi:ATP-binding cassette subfamily C protein CydD
LVGEPSVLLADEPTASLDARTARLVGEALFSAARSTALVLMTHDETLGGLADRIVRIGETSDIEGE